MSIRTRQAVLQLKPYSPGKPIWEVQREHGLDRVVKLASNENPLGPSPLAMEALLRSAAELHRYPDAGFSELRSALADTLGVTPEHIIAGNGADELIKLVAEAYLETGDEMIVPSPSFTEYEFTGVLMGARVVPVPLRADFTYDIAAILGAVTPRTKLVYVCTPHNPTGTYLPRGELEKLLEELPPSVLLIVDAAYGHYADADDYTDGLDLLRQGRTLLVLQTFSKIYGLAGIRVGYAVSRPEVIEALLKVKEPFNVNALAQTAAAAALADTDHVSRSRELNADGRRYLTEELTARGFTVVRPSQSNFILVRLGAEAGRIYEGLLQRGVIVRSAAVWGLPEYVRITIGTPEENDRLLEALAELGRRAEVPAPRVAE
ncbi:histidinol-phosphate transaminase [Paenibacillus chartarius]|uniref:Histidinol-phosphate aminotransferase n=1 Tax=Paenibacillus chartarius TaxID=747481 RepID=A0ABV6DGB7_9BACL